MARVQRVTLIVNVASGLKRDEETSSAIRDSLTSAGVPEIKVVTLKPGLSVATLIADSIRAGTDAVVAAGGDGTVSAVASALVGTETPLGVLPVGTLNHFAKDLGIPTRLEEAARVIAAGDTIRVDVGKVNGRIFLNNSSIGVYPAMVSARNRLVDRGIPKRLAMLAGIAFALWEFPNRAVQVSTSENAFRTRSPFVFVGNNRYELSGLAAGSRTQLQDGLLHVCTIRNVSRTALIKTLISAVMGHTEIPELAIATAPEARVITLRKRVPVGLDGELVTMDSPLTYSVIPRALTVLVGGES